MATAQYHYSRAEDIMQSAAQLVDNGVDLTPPQAQALMAQAQVHATLALVAVQAEASRGAAVMLDMHDTPRPARRPDGD